MLRTDDGKLAILDFGLMTEITEDQKYGMIEAIVHLINRDYTEIGQDFKNLDFIPPETDTEPIVVSVHQCHLYLVFAATMTICLMLLCLFTFLKACFDQSF